MLRHSLVVALLDVVRLPGQCLTGFTANPDLCDTATMLALLLAQCLHTASNLCMLPAGGGTNFSPRIMFVFLTCARTRENMA